MRGCCQIPDLTRNLCGWMLHRLCLFTSTESTTDRFRLVRAQAAQILPELSTAGECMDSCNAFAPSLCHGVGFKDSVHCLLFLEAGASGSDAPGLNRQAWTLTNSSGTGAVVASQMGLDGRGGACYRRQLDAACYPPGRVRKIVWEGCRCLTHWALELDDGSSESASQVVPGRNWRNCAGEAHLDGDEYILGMTQYGGGYCNFYGGWGRSFDFFTNKRTVNVKAPGKPQLDVASEIARRAVTVSRTKEGGKFFLFHKAAWISIFGVPPGSAPVKTRVTQLRRNELIWQGEVVVWSNVNGPHGRRSHEGESGQWQSGDLLVPAAGPDAGAIDFLLARMPSTATRKSEFVFRIAKMETSALRIKEISLFHATGTRAAALGGDVVMYNSRNVYGLNEGFTYTADGYIEYEDADVAGPGCTSGGKLRYGGLHDGDETKSDCNYQKMATSIGADVLSIQTSSRVRYVRLCMAQDAWAEFDILKDETSMVESKSALLGASQPGKLRCWLYTLNVAPEQPLSFMSKPGKGGCEEKVEGNLLLGHSGFSSEEKVQEKCRELRCGYYIWSNDPASSRHSAWFCMTNYYSQVSNGHEHPDWKVGFPYGSYTYGQAGAEECPAAASPLSLSECKVFALTDRAKNGQGKRCSSGSEGTSSSFTDACTGKSRDTELCNSRPKGCWAEDRGDGGLCVLFNDGPGTGAAGAVSICQKEDLAVQFRVDNLASSPGQLRFKRGGAWANKAVSTMVIHNASKYHGFAFTLGPMEDASPPGFAMGLSSRPDEEKEEWFKTWDFSVVQARQDQRLYILETNQLAGNAGQFGVLRSGDTVALAVNPAGKMEYWVNGELKHVSDKKPRYPLYVVGNFMASGARVKDIKWWEGKKDVVVNLEEKVQFSLRLQPGKQLLGPFVGPIAGLYPEGRVTQVGLTDVCMPKPPLTTRRSSAQQGFALCCQVFQVVTSTCGGTGGGAACKFPFEFNGKTYESCTKEGHDRPWCFTVGGADTWGNCDCPASLVAVGSATSASVAATTTAKGQGGRSFEYALVAASTRSGDVGYSSCWDIGEIQFFSDRMCRNQITVNSRSISVSTYEAFKVHGCLGQPSLHSPRMRYCEKDGLESYEYKEISKDMICRAGVDGQWYLGGRSAARGGLYNSLDACKDLCTAERSCTFFGYRAKDGRCEFFTAFGDCENKMGGAPGFAMYKKLKPLQTATAHEVNCAKMALLPVKKGPMEARCRSGNDLGDGFEYIFNTGAGTSAAACGEASTCECCMRPKKDEDGPWPVASKSNTRCGVLDMAAKVGVADSGECQRKAMDAGHAFFSLLDADGRRECLTSATCTSLVEAHGWRVYGRRPAGRKELFGRGSAALGVAQGFNMKQSAC
ncbi:unnamed protein product [Symbiodinium natans]|uniref:Fibronectin type-II domain-containing protein n=1 Tax=Symbiodinium natans TaxID=878477 RepID=A0A812JMR5_9DINO|nr:unnamed protein product [Symbiodinium natans]